MDKNLLLMDDIMGWITETDEWTQIELSDPAIVGTGQALDECLEKALEWAPEHIVGELRDRAADHACAYLNAAMLYGIHVALALLDVSARPADLSRYIMRRMGRDELKN